MTNSYHQSCQGEGCEFATCKWCLAAFLKALLWNHLKSPENFLGRLPLSRETNNWNIKTQNRRNGLSRKCFPALSLDFMYIFCLLTHKHQPFSAPALFQCWSFHVLEFLLQVKHLHKAKGADPDLPLSSGTNTLIERHWQSTGGPQEFKLQVFLLVDSPAACWLRKYQYMSKYRESFP